MNCDEIIGEFAGETETDILVKRPMQVSEITDDRTNISTIVLSKYLLFDDNQPMSFKKNHIITHTIVVDEIKDYYYTSVLYNAQFIEPIVKNQLSRANEMMISILRDQAMGSEDVLYNRPSKMMKENKPDDGIRVLMPSSNTIH